MDKDILKYHHDQHKKGFLPPWQDLKPAHRAMLERSSGFALWKLEQAINDLKNEFRKVIKNIRGKDEH